MAAQNQMHNLTTLIKRLEAATSRLEDIASSTELPKDVPGLAQPATPQSETAATPLPPAPKEPQEPQEALPESIEDFDVFLNTSLDKYIKLSSQLGGVVAQQAAEVLRGFQEQRKFLLIASKAAKPSTSGSSLTVYQNLLKPINDAVIAATELKESNRPDPMYSNLSAVADGIMVMGWVTVDRRPYTFVEESLGAAQFFGNRVLKEQKDNDPKQVEWVQSFYQIFHDLVDYIKQHHASGVAWNPRGEPAEEVAKALTAKSSQQPPQSSTPSAGAPPPPPPPPPPGPAPILDIPVESAKPANAAPAGGFGAVFSELNKGESVTKGLRKVDKSEMTHKNPALRTGSTVSEAPRAKSPVPGKKPKPESMRVKKPASKVLEANKWTIENYDKEPEPVEIDASITHSVLISRCNNTTVIIKGKANQVTVENSTRLSLVVDSLVSTVDVVKANNFALQVLGAVPTVMLDQIDSAQIYLSKESSATKLFTSKSDGINVNILAGPDDDYKEVPLPSQICSYWSEEKGELVSEIVAHAG